MSDQQPSARMKIEGLLTKQPSKWLSTGEIAESLPDVKRSMIYVTISHLATKSNRLVRRKRSGESGGYEYQISAAVNPEDQPRSVNGYGWTHDEKIAFTTAYMKLKKERSYLATSEVIREAQKALPVEKQRRYITKTANLPWLDHYILQVKEIENINRERQQRSDKLAEKAGYQPIGRESVPAIVPLQFAKGARHPGELPPEKPVETPLVEPVKQAVLPKEPEPVLIPLEISSLATDALIEELSKRASSILQKVLSQTIIEVFKSPQVREALTIKVNVNVNQRQEARRTDDVPPVHDVPPETIRPKHDPQPFQVDKPKLKKILVVGLINSQIREIEKEFQDTLDIRFWRTDEHTNMLKSKAGQADYTILVADFVSHSHQEILNTLGVKFIRHSGGMTKLKDLLTGIYVNESLPK